MPSFITLTVALALPLLAFSSPLYSNVSIPSSANAPFPKRGLIFHNPSSQYIQNWNGAGSQVNWAYNWDSVMDNTFPEWAEYIPMLWGTGSDHTSGWSNNANAALSRGSGHLLAFNEPDGCQSGVQACLSAQDAANAYMQYMMPFANKASLGAPAISNGASGLPWLKDFLSACASLGCRVDFVPIYWYDSATNIAYFQNYLNEAHDAAGGRQIWLTEFSGSGTEQQQASFLQQVMPWMDQQSWIFRYSWFWCDPSVNPLMVDGNGNPTDLGQVYAYTGY